MRIRIPVAVCNLCCYCRLSYVTLALRASSIYQQQVGSHFICLKLIVHISGMRQIFTNHTNHVTVLSSHVSHWLVSWLIFWWRTSCPLGSWCCKFISISQQSIATVWIWRWWITYICRQSSKTYSDECKQRNTSGWSYGTRVSLQDKLITAVPHFYQFSKP